MTIPAKYIWGAAGMCIGSVLTIGVSILCAWLVVKVFGKSKDPAEEERSAYRAFREGLN